MQGLFGIYHPSGGNVEVCGKKLHGGSIHEAMGAGIAMLPADRKENSVIPDMSLLENMYLSEHVLSARSFAINTKRENERFEKYGKLLNIKRIPRPIISTRFRAATSRRSFWPDGSTPTPRCSCSTTPRKVSTLARSPRFIT